MNIIHLDEIDSTNEYAKTIARESSDWTVIIAETQTKGKGRLNRTWFSPRGGIWMSIILKSVGEGSYATVLTLFTGIAVARALKELGLEVALKWPNDILVNKKKLGGILSEWEPEANSTIIGIGLNINISLDLFPQELHDSVTTTLHELKHEIDKNKLIEDLISEFKAIYTRFEKGQTEELLLDWKKYSSMIGSEVEVDVVGKVYEGKAIDIDRDGSLILLSRSGSEKKIIAGDVKIK